MLKDIINIRLTSKEIFKFRINNCNRPDIEPSVALWAMHSGQNQSDISVDNPPIPLDFLLDPFSYKKTNLPVGDAVFINA